MSWAVISAGVKIAGAYFGGKAKKKAAKEKAALMREEILLGRGWDITDLSLETRAQSSERESQIGATGARGSSGSFQAIRKDEAGKALQRRTRIMAGSELELKKVAKGLKSEVRAAKYEALSGAAEAVTGYYAGE